VYGLVVAADPEPIAGDHAEKLDKADPDASLITEILDSISGARERTQEGFAQVERGQGTSQDEPARPARVGSHMDPEPIACSLSAAGLEERYGDLKRFGEANLVDRDAEGDRQILRFRRTDEAAAGVRAIVAAEERCCPFLTFSLSETEDELVLVIEAPEDGRLVAEELAAAF
jgi:hypothetical protein